MDKIHAFLRQIYRRIRKVPHIDIVGLVAAMGVYATLVLSHISTWSIWFDEAFTAYIVRFNYIDIARYTATDVHPPLYYWVVKAWTSLWGTSEFAFRSFSLVCGVVAIALGFILIRKLFGKQAAVLSAWLIALSPMFIRYGEEARMYTMVTVIALGATYVLVRATETGARKYWVWYGILIALGMWTHYFAALVWLSHWVWRAIVVRIDGAKGRDWFAKFFTKEWIWTHVLALGVFAAWIPLMLQQLGTIQKGFWIPAVSAHTFTNYFTNVLFYLEQKQVLGWFALIYIVIVLLVSVLFYRAYRQTTGRQDRKNLFLLASLAFAPPVLLFFASMPPLKSSFVERYLIPATVGLVMLLAVVIVKMTRVQKGRRLAFALVVLIVASFAYGTSRVYYYGNYNKTNGTSIRTKELIESMSAKSQPGEPLIATDPWVFYEAAFYTTKEHPVYFLDQTTQYQWGSTDMLKYNDMFKIKDIKAFTKEHPVVWYFGNRGSGKVEPPSIVQDWQQIDTVAVYDSITKTSPYKAVRYSVTSE